MPAGKQPSQQWRVHAFSLPFTHKTHTDDMASTLFSAAVTDASGASTSSHSSNSSQDSLLLDEPAEDVKQTLQKRDYRPKSTLHHKARAQMTWQERIASRGLMPDSYHELKPATLDRGPIPRHSNIREHLYILSRGGFAPMLQQLSYWAFPGQSF